MTVSTAYKMHSIRDVRLRGGIRFRGSGKKAPASMKAIDVKMPNVAQSESRGSLLIMPGVVKAEWRANLFAFPK